MVRPRQARRSRRRRRSRCRRRAAAAAAASTPATVSWSVSAMSPTPQAATCATSAAGSRTPSDAVECRCRSTAEGGFMPARAEAHGVDALAGHDDETALAAIAVGGVVEEVGPVPGERRIVAAHEAQAVDRDGAVQHLHAGAVAGLLRDAVRALAGRKARMPEQAQQPEQRRPRAAFPRSSHEREPVGVGVGEAHEVRVERVPRGCSRAARRRASAPGRRPARARTGPRPCPIRRSGRAADRRPPCPRRPGRA